MSSALSGSYTLPFFHGGSLSSEGGGFYEDISFKAIHSKVSFSLYVMSCLLVSVFVPICCKKKDTEMIE